MKNRNSGPKNSWDLIFVPVMIGSGVALWFYFSRFIILYSESHIPNDAWFVGYRGASAELMFLPVGFACIPISITIAYFVVWCIPLARQAYEKEEQQLKSEISKEYFKRRGVITRFGFITISFLRWLIIISFLSITLAVPLSLKSATNFYFLKDNGITYQNFFTGKEAYYSWRDMKSIHVDMRYDYGRYASGFCFRYTLVAIDGAQFDIGNGSLERLYNAYSAMRPALLKHPSIQYKYNVNEAGLRYLQDQFPPNIVGMVKEILSHN